MNELADKVSEQAKQTLDKANDSFNQLMTASKGLIIKFKQSSSEQFDALVKAGEGKKLSEISEEFKSSISELNNPKESVTQIRYATIGLISKARDAGSKYFSEFVELGEGKAPKKPAAKSSSKKTKAAA